MFYHLGSKSLWIDGSTILLKGRERRMHHPACPLHPTNPPFRFRTIPSQYTALEEADSNAARNRQNMPKTTQKTITLKADFTVSNMSKNKVQKTSAYPKSHLGHYSHGTGQTRIWTPHDSSAQTAFMRYAAVPVDVFDF